MLKVMPLEESTSTSSYDLTSYQRILAASTGAVCTALLMTPLDVVKIRLQQQRHPVPTGSFSPSFLVRVVGGGSVSSECFIYSNGLMDHLCRSCSEPRRRVPCEWYARPGNFTGTLDAFIKITRHEGIRSLWSGLSPTLVMAVPTTAFYFSAYDWLVVRVRRQLSELSAVSTLSPAIAGAAARASAVTLVAPLEVVRTKMQSEHMSLQEIGRAVRSSMCIHGWRSLWLGWVPSLWRDVPFSALYWLGYEAVKSALIKVRGLDQVDFCTAFVSGALSGTIAAFMTNPFDVLKTKAQIEFGRTLDPSKKERLHSAVAGLVRERGVVSLWAGIVPRIAKVAPACAIMIASYEYFKVYFAHRNRFKSVSTD